ncbi:hypothetical protein BD413DRAFT_497786 [Trametes elegans]|nr:hypothetical protein BD413DRAFT_497786 [Trametes elegans]
MPDEPGNTKSSENAHPRRAAARKAAKLAAEQLESSPIPSDAENGARVSFRGEPSTPRSSVTKFTYGGKRKYMQSPLKSSPSSRAGPSEMRPRSKSLIEESPGKQKNGSGRGRGSSHRREGRQTKRTRTRSFPRSSSVENDSEHFSDPENTHDGPRAKEALQTQTKAPSTTDNPDETAAGHHATDKHSKKRPLSSSSMSSYNDGSLLNPSFSPEATRSGGARPMPVLAPRLARQFMRSKTLSGLTLDSPNKPDLKPAKSFDDLLLLDSTDEESFDELDVGNFGWVSIDLQGNLADADEDGDTLWWPAKVTFPRPCMRVLLIGNPPGDEVSGQRQLDIPEPTPSNVCSLLQNGRIRFTDTDYRPSHHSVQSPRKRRKLDLDEAWREARDLMVEADSARNEGRPFSLSAAKAGQASSSAVKRTIEPFPSLAPSKTKAKGKGKGKGKSVDLLHIDLDAGLSESRPEPSWRPPGPDPLLDIPGELVLARDSKARMQYWPAKLLEYIPPQNPRHKPKYKTLFFDGTIKSIDPEWFWTTADIEFSTCKLGESTGNYGLDSDVDSSDDEDEDFNCPFAAEGDTKLRAPSPLSSLPAPPPEEFEYDLTMSEQFAYVKPVLAAVIDGKYGPARHRHEDFMRGAGARRKILDEVPVRGSLSARDKEEVAYLVRSWARRRERRREMGLDVEYPSDKLYPCPGGEVGHANGRDEDGVNNDGHEQGDDDKDDARSAQSAASDVSGGDTEVRSLLCCRAVRRV